MLKIKSSQNFLLLALIAMLMLRASPAYAVTASDNFNRANETPLAAPWAKMQSFDSQFFNLSGNGVVVPDLNLDVKYYYGGITVGNDQFSQAAISVSGGSDGGGMGLGVALRATLQSTDNYYRLIVSNAASNNVELDSFIGGSYNLLAQRTTTWSDGDILRLEAEGTTLRMYKNGVQLGASVTDSSIASGAVGIVYSSTVSSGSIDNWSGGDLILVDTNAPTVPSNLSATTPSSSQINLSWTASTDNVAVTGYQVFRDGIQIATTSGTTYNDTGLSASTAYSYSVSAFDAALNISALSSPALLITTSAQNSATIFPLKLSADKRYLVDQNNVPFPILGRTAWFVISLSASDYQTFINDSVSRGYTSVEMHVINHDDRGHNPPFAGNGAAPFLKRLDGTDWNGILGGNAPDFTTPNETYWSYVDTFLNYCESQGIIVFMFPAYVGFAGGGQGWMQEMVANGPTRINTYGAFLSNRYRNQKNLVWMMGGDLGTFTQSQEDVEGALLTGLKSVQPQQSIFFSAEWDSEMIATDQSVFGPSMSLNGVYSFSGYVNNYGRIAYSHTPIEPAFYLEGPYDEEGADGVSYNLNATQPTRRFQWWGWLSTIGGYISGNGFVWTFNSPNWQNHLDVQGSRDMARLNAFVKSLDWPHLVPSQLAGMKKLVVGDQDNVLLSDYVTAAATPSGSLLVAYVPPDHTGGITVDMTAMGASSVGARWYDPTSGAYANISGSPFSNTGTHLFTPVGNNSSGFDDWVLVLNATVPDTESPSIPTGLTASSVSTSQINLSWTSSTDNIGVTGYKVFRDGSQINTSATNSYSDTGLAANTSYSYTVLAYDEAQNVSGQSSSASAITATVIVPPPSGGSGGSSSSGSYSSGSGAIAQPIFVPSSTAIPSPVIVYSPLPILPVHSQGGVLIFYRELSRGMTGEDVKNLQIFLNREGYAVATDGPGSPGHETNYFGLATYRATVRFQEANKTSIITPIYASYTPGVLDKATIAYINIVLSPPAPIIPAPVSKPTPILTPTPIVTPPPIAETSQKTLAQVISSIFKNILNFFSSLF